ncbi:hypothetical protein D018_0776B, partial [Vibrio parahaemolyticus VP2007-007]
KVDDDVVLTIRGWMIEWLK